MHETSDVMTKRYRIYTGMFELKLDFKRHTLISKPEDSSIFVMPVEVARDLDLQQSIIQRYESIFAETF